MLDKTGVEGEYIGMNQTNSILWAQYNFNIIIAKILGVRMFAFPYYELSINWNNYPNDNYGTWRRKMNNIYANRPELQYYVPANS